ncbi:MAG: AI-2E family transporter, partial [Bacteroidales bacterium]|nr:AI-2E family transporter [Bacteroidales bacterium]
VTKGRALFKNDQLFKCEKEDFDQIAVLVDPILIKKVTLFLKREFVFFEIPAHQNHLINCIIRMDKIWKILAGAFSLLIVLFLAWRFSSILAYILVAAVLSFIGRPVVEMLDKLHYKKIKIPHTLNAAITLLALIAVLVFLISTFIPLVVHEAAFISKLDMNRVYEEIQPTLHQIEQTFMQYNIIKDGESLESNVRNYTDSFIDITTFSDLFSNVIELTGNLFIALFSIIFISFFFLKDQELFYNGVMLIIPESREKEGKAIMNATKHLLSRYFIGLMIEVISMITILSIGLSILGVENALTIAFIGGLLNVIPYLGPAIGASIGVVLVTVTNLSAGVYEPMLMDAVKVAATFAVANLIDNMVLQPWIYSSSVKAHPLEIFLVIMIAGSLAGVLGMILAIPAYTVIRIVAKNFFSRHKLVKKLTEKI